MNLRSVARQITAELAPEEADIFDLVWHDYESDPDQPLSEADAYDQRLGLGGSRQTTSWSAVVIAMLASLPTNLQQAPEETQRDVEAWLAGQVQTGKLIVAETDAPRLAALPCLAAKLIHAGS